MRRLFLCALIPAFLAGCSNLPAITFPTLTLATVQAQAIGIETAVNQAAALAESDTQLSSVVVTEIKSAVTVFDTAAKAFTGLSTGETPLQTAAAFVTTAEGVVAVLPIDPATKAAVELGLAVVEAFAAGQTTSPVATTTTTTATTTVGATLKAMPIVSIPAPRYVPVS